jgi:hypothetical protein
MRTQHRYFIRRQTPKELWKAAYSHARLMLQGISGEDLFNDLRLRNVIHTKPQNKVIRHKSIMIKALQHVAHQKVMDSIQQLTLAERLEQFKVGF